MTDSINKTLWKRVAQKTKTKRGAPKNSEGLDGEITIRSTKRGVILYAKYGRDWYEFGSASPVSESVKAPKYSGGPIQPVSITHKTLGLTSNKLDTLGEIGFDSKNSKLYIYARDIFSGSSRSLNKSQVVRDNTNVATNISFTPNNAVSTIVVDTLMFTPGGNATIAVMDASATGEAPNDGKHLKIKGGAGFGTGGDGSNIYISPGAGSGLGGASSGDIYLGYNGTSAIGDTTIQPTEKLFFDGTVATVGGSYITESGTDVLDFYAGGINMLKLSEAAAISTFRSDSVTATALNGDPYAATHSTSFQTKAQISTSIASEQSIKVATVTISEAEMNALHTTEKVLVAAQGSNKVIIPIGVVFFVDRDASTAQGNTPNMFVGMNGSTTTYAGSWGYLKRFMWNEAGDRILQLHQGRQDEIAQTATYGDNQPLTAKLSGAITSGSIDSCKVVITYYVYDNS